MFIPLTARSGQRASARRQAGRQDNALVTWTSAFRSLDGLVGQGIRPSTRMSLCQHARRKVSRTLPPWFDLPQATARHDDADNKQRRQPNIEKLGPIARLTLGSGI